VLTSSSISNVIPGYWPSARHFTEAIQCPAVCFTDHLLKGTLPAVDRLGMPLVTSGQFAYVYKLKSSNEKREFAVRCFRGYLGDRDQRYRAIHRHLEANPVSFLSGFTYAPEGILVSGKRFPILFMEWIDGPTLDLYLAEMIHRRDVLLHLAQEWVRLIGGLRTAGIAHGDLQHGNIIVEHGGLRLVDHDGIFVPEMAGWNASEVGHQHYQHPHRDAQLFDSTLDNFSSIVIYLTLLSLAERPELWAEYHDENLLFTRADFIDPVSSKLFAQIREIGPEQRKLADVLAEAAKGAPASVPCLLDLVTVKTGLPSWMTAPIGLESKTKTREFLQADPSIPKEGARWSSWQARQQSPLLPATPQSSTVQTIFGEPASTKPNPLISRVNDPSAVWKNTLTFAKEVLGNHFLWWYWGVYIFLKIFGIGFFVSLSIAMICLATICLTYGFIRARQLARDALLANLAHTTALSSSHPAAASSSLSQWRNVAAPQPTPVSITVPDSIIGNTALNIYHVQDCDWVKQIAQKNRTSFASSSEATAAGYKACQVCSPTT